jgi:integrase
LQPAMKNADIIFSLPSPSQQLSYGSSNVSQTDPRRPMKNRRHDNTLVLGGAKHGAWTPHDLRRTGATIMQSLGIPLDTIDRCQNHVLQGSKIRRHYLHHDYAQEKREAWRQLGERISTILNAKDVV